MPAEPSIFTVVVGLIVAVVPSVVGWLIVRAVKGVDDQLKALDKKIDALVERDARTREAVAELRGRVGNLAYLVGGKAATH